MTDVPIQKQIDDHTYCNNKYLRNNIGPAFRLKRLKKLDDDKLFDQHLISFNRNGDIIISSEIDEDQYKYLNISKSNHIELDLSAEMYMQYHRELLKRLRPQLHKEYSKRLR